jgi:hypothetical protein
MEAVSTTPINEWRLHTPDTNLYLCTLLTLRVKTGKIAFLDSTTQLSSCFPDNLGEVRALIEE